MWRFPILILLVILSQSAGVLGQDTGDFLGCRQGSIAGLEHLANESNRTLPPTVSNAGDAEVLIQAVTRNDLADMLAVNGERLPQGFDFAPDAVHIYAHSNYKPADWGGPAKFYLLEKRDTARSSFSFLNGWATTVGDDFDVADLTKTQFVFKQSALDVGMKVEDVFPPNLVSEGVLLPEDYAKLQIFVLEPGGGRVKLVLTGNRWSKDLGESLYTAPDLNIEAVVKQLEETELTASNISVISLIDNSDTTSALDRALNKKIVTTHASNNEHLFDLLQKNQGKDLTIFIGHVEDGKFVTWSWDPVKRERQAKISISLTEIHELARKSGANVLLLGCGSSDHVASGIAKQFLTTHLAERLGVAVSESNMLGFYRAISSSDAPLVIDAVTIEGQRRVITARAEARDQLLEAGIGVLLLVTVASLESQQETGPASDPEPTQSAEESTEEPEVPKVDITTVPVWIAGVLLCISIPTFLTLRGRNGN